MSNLLMAVVYVDVDVKRLEVEVVDDFWFA